MQDVINWLKSEGYELDEFIPDNKIHRFSIDPKDKKKSGFYVGFRNFSSTTGEEHFVCVVGSWRGEETKTYSTAKGVLNASDSKKIKDQISKAKKTQEKIREREQEGIAGEVSDLWSSLSDHGGVGAHEYIQRKQISEIDLGVKVDERGNLVVPARDFDGRIWSVQYIGREGNKWFHPGGRIRGCFHAFGDIKNAEQVYLAEGFATGASIFLATGKPVICAFTSNNLVEVSCNAKRIYPGCQYIVCGDEDRWSVRPNGEPFNPGRIKAEEAARVCLGEPAFPRFGKLDSKPTDWNDLHCLEGIDEVRSQLGCVKADKHYLLALGFKEKEYFFTSSKNQQIVGVSRFSKVDFLNLMPLEYWEAVFPGAGASKVDWDAATTSLMEAARKKGIFESQNIRGAGVWNDNRRVVVNMGDHLLVDGKRSDLGEISSRYFYTLGIKLPGLHPSPLTENECEVILSACHSFKWKKPDFGFLLAGAMVTTRVCGALPIRPHVWLTGEKGSGKTTLFNRLIYPLIGEPLIFAGGNSTEAGIRQEVCANAVPVLFDEFENNGPKSAEMIQSTLDLMRLSWSETRASVIKGGSGGVATSYRARFAAIVTSIRQTALTDADQSRFATLELDAHGNDPEHWKELDALLNRISIEYGNRLFARTIKLLPVLLENFKTMKKVLGGGQRFSDQYGMLLAGYGLLLQDEAMSEDQARVIAGHVALEEEKEVAKETDQDACLRQLLTTKCSYEGHNCRSEALVGDLIKEVSTGSHILEEKALLQLGIKVDLNFVSIASLHSELESKVFRGTRWSKSWTNALCRLPGGERNRSVWMAGKNAKCVRIPISSVLEPTS